MRDDRAVTTSSTRVRELAFLHEIAQLATQARDWDELMRSIVDGTTAAMDVEVCSFYLADHERTRLTLAATNGLDRSQVGRVSLAWGEGITGRVAASRAPIAVEDVTRDERFAWVRGFDIEGLAGMLSVPLVWHEDVVGVLNVQTRAVRLFSPDEVDLLQTIGASAHHRPNAAVANQTGRVCDGGQTRGFALIERDVWTAQAVLDGAQARGGVGDGLRQSPSAARDQAL